MCALRSYLLVVLIFLASDCESWRPRPLMELTRLTRKYPLKLWLPITARAIDRMLNRIKKEIHIPGYQFCGPGTKLDERLARGETGVNKLDNACLQHDIAYRSRSLYRRFKADKTLLAAAQARSIAIDARIMEKLAAYFVVEAMKIKTSGNVFDLVSFMSRMRKLFSRMKKYKSSRRNVEYQSLDVVSDENSMSVEKDRKFIVF